MAQDEGTDNPYERLVAVARDTEMALLGAALINPAALDVCAPFVDASDFSQPFLGMLWQSMVDMHGAGTAPTPTLLSLRISSPELVAEIARTQDGKRPIEIIAAMASAATTVIGAPDYAKTVREFRHRRDLSIAGEALVQSMHNPMVPFREAAGLCSESIEVAFNHGEAPKRSVADMIALSVEALDSGAAPGITTGLRDLDTMIGGFVVGDLVVVGARPSMGKSAFTLSTVLSSAHQALRRMRAEIDEEPWAALIMTHEMTRDQVTQRCLTDLAFRFGDTLDPVTYNRFRPAPGQKHAPLSWTQREGIKQASNLLPRIPIAIDGRPGMTISEVTATIRLHKKRFAARGLPLKLVAVDHIGLGKIMAVRVKNNPILEIGEITTGLKATAVNEEMCVVACHQLSRANEGRENKRPTLSDFRDSGHIEQDADVMIGLYRDAYYLERSKENDSDKEETRRLKLTESLHDMEAFVLKNRQGRVGMVNLWAHMGANAVRDAKQR